MTEDRTATDSGLIVSFPDQSESFVYGFQAGEIWSALRRGDQAEIELTTHAINREVISRMAVAEGWQVEVEPTEVEGWDQTKLRKSRPAPERPNPHGLRVI